MTGAQLTTVLHVSDLHFGKPYVPEQIEAIEALIQAKSYTVVAVSGDVSQRARSGEFQRARVFLRDAQRVSKTIIVPGNHDVKWWYAPLGIGGESNLYKNYQAYISKDLEPVLRVPGVTFVGLNTAHGVRSNTLTWNPRDISIVGDLRNGQLEWARRTLEQVPEGDARVVVMHHNPVKGELSRRHGLVNSKKILGAFAEMGVDLVLCGHDHQEAIHYVEHTKKGTVISTAGTVSNRSRGGRPSSLNTITIGPDSIHVETSIWSPKDCVFVPGPSKTFNR
ncbi:MAG: metallophosphoesterase [Gemmatimonadaceae bacterium]